MRTAVAAMLLLAACEQSGPEKLESKLAVHCLLLAHSGWARANVNRTYSIDETMDTLFAGASVLLARGEDTWQFEHVHRDLYQVELRQLIRPGDTFYLQVAKDGFDTVFGHTVIPDTFRILYPASGDTVSLVDSLGWTRSRNCAGYDIALEAIYPNDTFYYDLPVPNDSFGLAWDSLVVRIPSMFFLYGFDEGPFRLPVMALDTNYFAWISSGGFGMGGGVAESTGLVGGAGVFGSACERAVEFYLQPDTTRR